MNIKKLYRSRNYKILEFLLFFIAVPIIFKFNTLEGWLKIIPLFLIAGFFTVLLLSDKSFDSKILYTFNFKQFRRSVYRLVVIAILIIGFTWWFYTDLLFEYIVEEPYGYMVTFFLYPIASVIPQEIIYRVYFFHRYRSIFTNKLIFVFVNAFVFGLIHVIYDNWVAPIATFLAAILFVFNYYKSRTLLNVSFEHYVYGIILFTAGLGYFFQ